MRWLLLAGCLAAALQDIRTRRISNRLLSVLFAVCFGFRLLFQEGEGSAWLTGTLQMCAAGAMMVFPWRLRMVGSGDVKLFMVLGAFLDTDTFVKCSVCAVFMSGILAAGQLVKNGNAAERFRYFGKWAEKCLTEGKLCPYMRRKDFSRMNTIPLSVGILLGYVCMLIIGSVF